MSSLRPISADGHGVRWETWDGGGLEELTLRWENEGWTAVGDVGRERVQYVLRLSPSWLVRQFLLFRDLEQPDLWLATDGHHRWGEMNGAHRPELDGCVELELACSPFPFTVPIRRLPLAVGDGAEVPVVTVDVETLAAEPGMRRYEHCAEHTWRVTDLGSGAAIDLTVDAYGLVLEQPGRFRRR